MRFRFVLLTLAAALLLATAALADSQVPAAAAAPAPAVTTAAAVAAPMDLLAGPLARSCSATATSFVTQLPADGPAAPHPTAAPTCGSCSTNGCAGLPFNAQCYYLSDGGYHLAHCQPDFTCSNGSDWCICTNNPPP
jgi:hypothetical protein